MNKARLMLIACAAFGIWVILSPFLAKLLIVEKPLQRAEAILVLSGSAVYKERVRHAADLYKQGVAPQIFITNDVTRSGWFDDEESNTAFIDLEQRRLIAEGVPADAITVLPEPVAGTDEEAKALQAELETRPLKSVLIVTSAYHTRRSLWTFEKILAGTGTEIGIAHPPPGIQTPPPAYWWLKPRGWQTVAAEYVKFALYYAYY